MTTIAATNSIKNVRYGAAELKAIIARNTKKAFFYTMLLLLLLTLFSFSYKLVVSWLFPPPNVVKVLLSRVSLDALAPPPSENPNEPPPPPPPASAPPASGPAARAGTPVAIPDALMAPDVKDFASVDEINRTTAVGGDGQDFGGFSDGGGVDPGAVNIQAREQDPDPDDFVAVEDDPKFDYDALQKRVKYPDMARRNNIEGMVTVRALVGRDGRVTKTIVQASDNSILNEEAEKAVKITVFTPAKQNGQPVAVWMSIPIKFRLR